MGKYDQTDKRLTLFSVQYGQSEGRYMFRAKNVAGEISTTAKLTVKSKMSIVFA